MEFNSSLSDNDEELLHVPNVLYKNRYCTQDDFNILICGGISYESVDLPVSNDVYQLKGQHFEASKLPNMLEAHYYCKTAVINSDILVVGGYRADTSVYSVEVFKNNRKSLFYKTD